METMRAGGLHRDEVVASKLLAFLRAQHASQTKQVMIGLGLVWLTGLGFRAS
jgi:hypothetical protein